jgi:hypothetical protein
VVNKPRISYCMSELRSPWPRLVTEFVVYDRSQLFAAKLAEIVSNIFSKLNNFPPELLQTKIASNQACFKPLLNRAKQPATAAVSRSRDRGDSTLLRRSNQFLNSCYRH